ncbi:MAG: hypothetical protein M1821_006519 [Bathelium mastoideum]|nr:MAG: hypothetical protein M1821_006519 [Bathelium mastoideum]
MKLSLSLINDWLTVPLCAKSLSVLPALLQASLLALLSASIPLVTTYTTTAFGLTPPGDLISTNTLNSQTKYTSYHVFAFTSQGDLLLAESEGSFDMDTWQRAYAAAEEQCLGKKMDEDDDIVMDQQGDSLQERLKVTLQNQIELDRQWKNP